MGFKSSHWSCLKAWFKGYTFCFTSLARPSTGAQQSHWTSLKKRSNDFETSKFRQQVQNFVCVPPWRCVTFKFGEIIKIDPKVTLVLNFSFVKISNFLRSFVECKVSLADGIYYPSQPSVEAGVQGSTLLLVEVRSLPVGIFLQVLQSEDCGLGAVSVDRICRSTQSKIIIYNHSKTHENPGFNNGTWLRAGSRREFLEYRTLLQDTETLIRYISWSIIRCP